MENVKNLIFDLGGVVINLDVHKTLSAFAKLSGGSAEEVEKYYHEDFFKHYETGKISSEAFRANLRAILPDGISDQEIDQAWNAMLLDIPAERINLIRNLPSDLNKVVLSNTNEIHIKDFNRQLAQVTGYPSLDPLFDQVYFSFHMGMRKPDREIFEEVLRQQSWKAEETLLLDDTIANLEAARELGIQTTRISEDQTMNNVLKEWTN